MLVETRFLFASLSFVLALIFTILKLFTCNTELDTKYYKKLSLVFGLIFYLSFVNSWKIDWLRQILFVVLFFGPTVLEWFKFSVPLTEWSECVMHLIALILVVPKNTENLKFGFTVLKDKLMPSDK